MKTAPSLMSGLPGRRFARPAWVRELFRKRVDVLPVYQPQRAGWVIAARHLALLTFLVMVAAIYGVAAAILPLNLFGMMAAPLGLVAVAVIWALPEARTVPTGLLTRLFIVFLGVQLLWPNYIAISAAGLPWISLRRVIGAAVFLVFLVCLSMSRSFRSEIKAILKATRPASIFFLVYFVSQFIAAIFSIAPLSTISRLLVASYTTIPMFFIALWVLGSGRRSIDWWVNWIFVFLTVLMVIGVAELRLQHVLWANSIPSWLHVDEDVLKRIFTPNFRGAYRVVTTFTVPLVWGELITLVMPLALHRIANAKSLAGVAAWCTFDLALCVSAFLCGARLAVVGGIVAHAVYLLLWALRRWRMDRGGLLGLSLTMVYPALVILFMAAVTLVPAVHNRVLGGGSSQLSDQGRREQWALGIPAIAKRPLFGYGPGEGAGAVGWRTESGFLSIDSGFLSTASDYGVIGFCSLFGGVIALAVMLGYQGLSSRAKGYPQALAFVAVFAAFLSSRSVLAQGDNDPFYCMLFGVGIAVLYLGKGSQEKAVAPTAG